MTGVNGRTAGKQRVGLGRTAVILQWTEKRGCHRRRNAVDGTAHIAHQVVAIRRESPRAISEYGDPQAQQHIEAGLTVPGDDGVLETERAARLNKDSAPSSASVQISVGLVIRDGHVKCLHYAAETVEDTA